MAELHLVRPSDPADRDKLVVVKRLHPQLAIDPLFVRMFIDEARIASTLHHPNVVEVYEVGDHAGQYYIAMEHLHGKDLRHTMVRLMDRHAVMRLDQALSIARYVATGLHYTHERTGADGALLGIVHRDVSPHNVLLTYEGGVKIVDFGVAKARIQLSRTRTGVVKGKLAYMSPEQAAGRPLDRRSDVFCIGVLLWEMTTGRWLYRRQAELDMLNAVAHSAPPRPSRLVDGYPRDLEKVVMKTLARSPDDRWSTAGELIAAIDEVARRRRLGLGAEPVRALMATAFAEELAAWRRAQALGVSLGDHLVAEGARLPAPSEVDTKLDDEDLLPEVPAIGTRSDELVSRRRRWLWPVLGATVAAGIAAIGIVSATRSDPEPRTVPAAHPMPQPVAPGPGPTAPAVPQPPLAASPATVPPAPPAGLDAPPRAAASL
ncbi:MAG TPA: protein kinase, partial [Kofleriaceae bacterium]